MNHNDSKRLQSTGVANRVSSKLSIALILLIILQSYFVPLISLISGTDYDKYVDYSYFYVLSSYTIIVGSILVFRDKGLEILQDHFSLWAIILTCFFRANLGGTNELFYKGLLIFLGLSLLAYVVANRKTIKTPNLKSLLIGLFWSAGTTVILSLIRVLLDPRRGVMPSNLTDYFITTTMYQLSFVTVIEEALFRGLLFGLLLMNGYKENTALFIQSVLFCGIHYLKLNDPILFFILLPLFTLSVSLIVKKYKMLYLSIMVHTFNNVFGGLIVALM
jgi:membrane protease YdiL (CAAX protease family)